MEKFIRFAVGSVVAFIFALTGGFLAWWTLNDTFDLGYWVWFWLSFWISSLVGNGLTLYHMVVDNDARS